MAMTIVETTRPVTAGVDTHAETHVAAVIDHLGGVLGIEAFETTEAGYQRLVGWLRRHGEVEQVGVEASQPARSSASSSATSPAKPSNISATPPPPPDPRTRRRRRFDPHDSANARHGLFHERPVDRHPPCPFARAVTYQQPALHNEWPISVLSIPRPPPDNTGASIGASPLRDRPGSAWPREHGRTALEDDMVPESIRSAAKHPSLWPL
jgi:Transposase